KLADRPRSEPRPDGDRLIRMVVRPRRRIGSKLPEDRVDEPPVTPPHEVDGLGYGRMRGDPCEQELIRAEAKRGPRYRLGGGQRTVGVTLDGPVQRNVL